MLGNVLVNFEEDGRNKFLFLTIKLKNHQEDLQTSPRFSAFPLVSRVVYGSDHSSLPVSVNLGEMGNFSGILAHANISVSRS